ncbi:hypothetical protein PIB30_083095 [Stylosanthes scabra]|uniref:Uncharacterized protein n=1 Tax=Stylosanthes scabra TaxID=79078 RepID=A0ABU6TSM2_9FABA|nr:hypothetical protein [Stylosanthes scabra]
MMESLETGRCLWMVTNQNIFGFRVDKLELLGKNDARDSEPKLKELPFDFRLALPKRDLHHFVFDSKLFFAGGSPDFSTDSSPDFSTGSSPKFFSTMYQVSYAGGSTLDIAEVEPAAGTIPDPPTLIYECNVANIQDDVYLLAHDPMTKERRLGFWVLRSGSKQWHPLPPPPTLSSYGTTDRIGDKPPFVYLPWWQSFVWKDQLFLRAFLHPDERESAGDMLIYYVYNPEKYDEPWKRIERPFTGVGRACASDVAAVPSLGKVGNCDVALTWSTEDHEPSYTSDVKIYALLVDKQDNLLRKECLHEGIPYSFISYSINVNFVDLGEGKVCILMGGTKADTKIPTLNPILCVLVLKLALVQEEQEEGQRFLSVDEVLVNRVYDITPYVVGSYDEVPRSSFFSSLKQSYSQGGNSPRKEPKLASGTNPSNPRALLE